MAFVIAMDALIFEKLSKFYRRKEREIQKFWASVEGRKRLDELHEFVACNLGKAVVDGSVPKHEFLDRFSLSEALKWIGEDTKKSSRDTGTVADKHRELRRWRAARWRKANPEKYKLKKARARQRYYYKRNYGGFADAAKLTHELKVQLRERVKNNDK